MIQYILKYDEEIKLIIKDNPKCFMSVIKSIGKKDPTKDKSYLMNYILSCTKILDSDVYTLKTRIYWTINHIEDFNDKRVRCQNPKCKTENGTPFVGKNVKKINEGYIKSCCKQCERDIALINIESNLMKTYGVKNVFQLDSVKEILANKKTDSMSKALLKKFELYGDPFYNNATKAKETKLDKYGSVWNLKKIAETKQILHGNPHWNNPLKNFETKSLHNTFNESDDEKLLKLICIMLFGNDVKFQFKSEKYPFACDFYISSKDIYVEYNGIWTHGKHPYDKNDINDIQTVNEWKQKNTKFYDNAILTWTIRDPNKRDIALKNNINLKEFWNITDIVKYFISLKSNDLLYVFPNARKLKTDKTFFDNKLLLKQSIPMCNNHNYIIKFFQLNVFYKKENELWQNSNIQTKLIANRCKYLNKKQEDLTDLDLLDGFKHSGIYYGYSHFNPLLFKWFIQNYDVKKCYDPYGGWGHRLLGANDLQLYIYNDKSPTVKANVDNMIDYFNITNTITYNNDAIDFLPEEDFDTIFTCPPYYNLEKYECGQFKTIEDFEKMIDSLFDIFKKKNSCKLLGLIIRDDMLFKHTDFIEKFEIMPDKNNYLSNKSKKVKEYLYVYRK